MENFSPPPKKFPGTVPAWYFVRCLKDKTMIEGGCRLITNFHLLFTMQSKIAKEKQLKDKLRSLPSITAQFGSSIARLHESPDCPTLDLKQNND